jgi:diphthamide biosynthesis protein 7
MDSPDRASISKYTTRTLDQEIDTVAICPLHSDYMIVGTYSLIKKDTPTSYAGQTRQGSLRVMTVSSSFTPTYVGMLPPRLDRVDLPCAVLDVHFHPADPTLLGVATSNASVYFYRFVVRGDVLGRRVTTRLLPLGNVRISEDDEHGLTPLTTQFSWFEEARRKGTRGVDDVMIVALAATTSFGETSVARLRIPAVRDVSDHRVDGHDGAIRSSCDVVHRHDLEAWSVASINFNPSKDTEEADNGSGGGQRLILSGGDDSAVVASCISPATPFRSDEGTLEATRLWKDRKNHAAGVVAILPLTPPPPPPPAPGHTLEKEKEKEKNAMLPQTKTTPLLTGSYDEFLRIFEIDTQSYRASLKTELRLNGGVWRLKVLDMYTTVTDVNITPDERGSRECQQHHYLVLASLMHAGAVIIRISYTEEAGTPGSAPHGEGTWTITPLATFSAGHESMVYCCDARLENGNQSEGSRNDTYLGIGNRDGNGDGDGNWSGNRGMKGDTKVTEPPTYTIVSTSFYDMKICTWTFLDEFKFQAQASS